MIGTCLKSVSKTPTLRFFQDYWSFFTPPPFFRLQRLCFEQKLENSDERFWKKGKKPPFLVILGQKANFDQFLAKMAKTVKIIKKALGTFFSRLQALTNCKASEKSNERFPRKCVTDERTYERTYVRTYVRTDRRDS